MAHFYRLVLAALLSFAGLPAWSAEQCLLYRAGASTVWTGWKFSKVEACLALNGMTPDPAGYASRTLKDFTFTAPDTCVGKEEMVQKNGVVRTQNSGGVIAEKVAEGLDCTPHPVEPEEPSADDKCAILAGDFNNVWRSPPVNREGRVSGKLPLGETSTVCMPVDPDTKFGNEGYKPPPGCKHQFTAEMSFSYDNTNWFTDGTSWAQTHGSGLACVPGLDPNSNPTAPPTVEPDPPCKGTQGTVNGQSVCIAASSGYTNGVDWNQISDANGNTSSVRTDVSCKGEQCTVTTTTTPNASNNGGTGGSSTTNTSSVSRDQYCANNPKSTVCGGARDSSGVTRGQGGSGSGSGGDDGDDDVTAPGAPGGQIPELWKKKYPDGVKGVWDSKSADLKESGLGGLASSLMPSVSDGGSQPSWQIDLDFGGYWNWGTFTLSPDPAVWAALRAFTIICALVLARRLVYGG